MQSLPVVETKAPGRRLPAWLKRPLPRGNENYFTDALLRELRLEDSRDGEVTQAANVQTYPRRVG